jgi:Ca2+/Na+ antiporter
MSPDYFEKTQRRQYLSPSSKWPLLVGGIGFLIAASIVETRTHNLSRAAAWIAVGTGMILYGFTEIMFQRNPLRWTLVLASLVLWIGGAYWAVRAYL